MEVAATSETAAHLNDHAVKLQAEGKYAEADDLYKKSLAIWQEAFGHEDPLVAQSLANRAALYRAIGEHHEAERLFQIALRIWKRRGFPETYDAPLWADQFDKNLMLKNFGAYVRGVRQSIERGDPAGGGD